MLPMSKFEWHDHTLSEIRELTPFARVLRFKLPDHMPNVGLTVSSSMIFSAPCGENGERVGRKYTPLDTEEPGYADYLVKMYPEGKMTPYLFKLKVGDKVSMAKHPGKDIEALRGKGVLLLAGGSGIAPMVQLLHEISRKPDFEIKSLTLVFSGINETDLYVREKLHAIQEKLGDKLKTYYLVLNPSEQWTGLKGYTDETLVTKLVEELGEARHIVLSGPPRMMEQLIGPKKLKKTGELGGLLAKLGLTRKQMWTMW